MKTTSSFSNLCMRNERGVERIINPLISLERGRLKLMYTDEGAKYI
jgi:hypothetical protein